MKNHLKFHPLIWMVGTAFTLLQFTLQLSSGVIIDNIMQTMHLTALSAGLLSGLFYVIYTSLQIPVGIICDHYNPRPILCASTLVFALGCVLFATSYHLPGLYYGRALLALGSAFPFIALTHLIREHYPRPLFGVLIGATETLSFGAAILGIVCLGALINHLGWRDYMKSAALLACLTAWLCWHTIPSRSTLSQNGQVNRTQIWAVLTNKPLWLNGLFIGLTFILIPVFGALWAPPFLQIKLHCSLAQASYIDSIFILGIGISCPIFGYLGNHVQCRQRLIITAYLATAGIFLLVLYLPIQNLYLMSGMMLALGLLGGAYILGYTFANELAPPGTLSTTTGLTNTLALVTTPIFQPLIGALLDTLHAGRVIEVQDYQYALSLLPMCILIAVGLIRRVKLPTFQKV